MAFRLVRSLDELRRAGLTAGRAVGVTIGNFDGVHLGHQALISGLQRSLSQYGRAALPTLLTFYPHPRAFLARQRGSAGDEPLRIGSLRDRFRTCAQYGVELVFAKRFDRMVAELEPEQFLERYLVRGLQARSVVVGYDWSFGRGRRGSTALLQRWGQEHGVEVVVVPPVTLDGERVSSGAVKREIESGNIERASAMLGRPYRLSGWVVHGERRGRSLGFPTANLRVPSCTTPGDGVYAAWVRCAGRRYPAATNIGSNPTFDGRERLIESHLLEPPVGELYGERIEVEFVRRIREERRFGSKEELISQISEDVRRIRALLADEPQ